MSYNYFYSEDGEMPDFEDLISRAPHKSASEALYCIIEQLYDSANAIDEEKLRQSFAYLCDELDIDDDMLSDPHGLCVVHWKKAHDWLSKADSSIVNKNFTGWAS